MSSPKEDSHNIISSSLKLVKECPVCSTRYTTRRAQIVEQTEAGYLIYFSCIHCNSSLLANITEMPFGLVGSAMLTDLELNEVQKFKNSEPVTVDDVLEVHQKLEK